ncbi:uncharacterized protein LY89DRAFT_669863 [Mollisia scopiformis]|uniref:Uncharacterized protein n=1 Tax=Mollisia scopiformis TaxID=149040 RepID=A0A194X851_MOLSC|nr:uncharacterized protein LY89DRAFT_669863 [Mollisia scopiformis]KUJ16341.1 hypothetical protein LY89DRAFT_669863 [Mollisia scopiformis]
MQHTLIVMIWTSTIAGMINELLTRDRYHMPRIPKIKDESFRFFILHAILDQVLSIEGHHRIDWIKVSEDVGYKGQNPSTCSKKVFAATWKALHRRSFVQDKKSKIDTVEAPPEYVFERCVGNGREATVNWAKLAETLGNSSEKGERDVFNRMWNKYWGKDPHKTTAYEKMDEYYAYIKNFDQGHDDEEPGYPPPPPYEDIESQNNGIKHPETANDGEAMELVPRLEGIHLAEHKTEGWKEKKDVEKTEIWRSVPKGLQSGKETTSSLTIEILVRWKEMVCKAKKSYV